MSTSAEMDQDLPLYSRKRHRERHDPELSPKGFPAMYQIDQAACFRFEAMDERALSAETPVDVRFGHCQTLLSARQC